MVDLIALGPLELRQGGERYELGPLMNRRVLAVLLHARGKPVSTEVLAERIWGESEPRGNSADTIRTYICRLRKHLKAAGGEGRLQRCAPGRYRLVVRPEEVDLLRFDRLRHQASVAIRSGDASTATELLRKAEALWRGEPLTEFTSEWAGAVRSRLNEHLLRVKEQRIELALQRGEHSDLIAELHELVAQHPTAERFVGYLMLALYRSERHSESLEVYRTTYRRFKQAGTSPKTHLQQLNQQIINQDGALDLPSAVGAGRGTHGPGPDRSAPAPATPTGNLPPDTHDFTGRRHELTTLLADVGTRPDDDPTTSPLHVIYGMPGIGKTAIAVRAARRMAHRFPDGVQYVDLHGYSGEASHLDPHEALAMLLRTSRAADKLPDSLDERIALWREWTTRHGALVVLDNARFTQQVTPLLPVSPSCRTLITSRDRLPGLDGARDIYLDALSVAEAMALFKRVAGASRTTDERALRCVVEACGRHPLALRLLAGRYRARTSWDLEYLHERLTQSHDPLKEFDPVLAQAFQFSYTELTIEARLLLRRLALHTGPDITLSAASALLGAAPSSTRPIVEALLDAHLLTEVARDRFSLHDLVRAFANQACRRDEPEAEARSASRRLFAYYLQSADHADRLANPERRRLRVMGEATELPLRAREFSDADEASSWLEMEQANLLAAVRTAIDAAPRYIPRFAHVLAPALKLWGVWYFAARLHDKAVAELRDGIEHRALAQALTDRAEILALERPSEALKDASEALGLFEELSVPTGCADALLQIGRSHLAAGRIDDSLVFLDRALNLYRNAGDLLNEGETLNVQGVALHYQGDHRAALECFRATLSLAQGIRNPRLESKALNNIGDLALIQERYDLAKDYFERAHTLNRQFGGVRSRAIVACNLAAVHKASGDLESALSALRRALATYRAGGDKSGEADTLVTLGETYAEMKRLQEALLHFSKAEDVSRSIENGYEEQRALIGIADIHRASGRTKAASDTYEQALRLSRAITYPLGSARALDGLARTTSHSPNGGNTREFAERAIALYERLGRSAEASALRGFLFDTEVAGS